MDRMGVGLLAALVMVQAAHAQDGPPGGDFGKSMADAHCAALGEGFFAVKGSSACIKISGHISAGVGFATGAAAGGHSFGGAPITGSATEEGVTGDMRFDTPIGPGRVYVDVHNSNGSRWLTDGQ